MDDLRFMQVDRECRAEQSFRRAEMPTGYVRLAALLTRRFAPLLEARPMETCVEPRKIAAIQAEQATWMHGRAR